MSRSLTNAIIALSFSVALGGGPAPEQVRAQILDLTNKFRASEKKKPLKLNSKLAAAAQKHVENIARQDKFGDDDENGHILDGMGPKDRVDREGYQSSAGAENVAFFSESSGPKVAAMVLEGWKNSPQHRENLVSEKVTEIGIGAAKSKSGKWYFCQVFGKPR
jgi:uncharacterized protein YkwD